ncbi:MAG: hypothetical protein DHS20C15_04590 [Planctomycetota bacterium]|nr:MAG: hypothetical protein DHS20C15_04590 [Planctomycetota bacterium]
MPSTEAGKDASNHTLTGCGCESSGAGRRSRPGAELRTEGSQVSSCSTAAATLIPVTRSGDPALRAGDAAWSVSRENTSSSSGHDCACKHGTPPSSTKPISSASREQHDAITGRFNRDIQEPEQGANTALRNRLP